jgi:hypothetical protein
LSRGAEIMCTRGVAHTRGVCRLYACHAVCTRARERSGAGEKKVATVMIFGVFECQPSSHDTERLGRSGRGRVASR